MAQRFSERASRAVVAAQKIAEGAPSRVLPLHILLAVLDMPDSVACHILKEKFCLDLRGVHEQASKLLQGSLQKPFPGGTLPFTDDAKKVIEQAADEANHMGHGYVGTEHLVLGLFKDDEAKTMLNGLGVKPDYFRECIFELVPAAPPDLLPLSMSRFLAAHAPSITAWPEVRALVVTDISCRVGNPSWNIVLIVLKNSDGLERVFGLLEKLVPGFADLPVRLKIPGKRPLKRVLGEWVEDKDFDSKVEY